MKNIHNKAFDEIMGKWSRAVQARLKGQGHVSGCCESEQEIEHMLMKCRLQLHSWLKYTHMANGTYSK